MVMLGRTNTSLNINFLTQHLQPVVILDNVESSAQFQNTEVH